MKDNRLGERRVMKCGEEAEIVEYRKYDDITIRFINTGEEVGCRYDQFKNREIKSHFTPSVFGVGIVGLGNIKDENGNLLKSYQTWHHMIQRCYDKKYQQKQPTYIGCTVCDEWLYYPNFKIWFNKNYYEIGGQRMNLDKDILFKGNKVYSPDNCVFVPQRINLLFTKKDANRGKLPIGVCWHKRDGEYQANCSIFDIENNKSKRKHLGSYNTPEDAFNAYKIAKEENIKEVADYYRDQIPERLYEAMCRYEVEIDD